MCTLMAEMYTMRGLLATTVSFILIKPTIAYLLSFHAGADPSSTWSP